MGKVPNNLLFRFLNGFAIFLVLIAILDYFLISHNYVQSRAALLVALTCVGAAAVLAKKQKKGLAGKPLAIDSAPTDTVTYSWTYYWLIFGLIALSALYEFSDLWFLNSVVFNSCIALVILFVLARMIAFAYIDRHKLRHSTISLVLIGCLFVIYDYYKLVHALLR